MNSKKKINLNISNLLTDEDLKQLGDRPPLPDHYYYKRDNDLLTDDEKDQYRAYQNWYNRKNRLLRKKMEEYLKNNDNAEIAKLLEHKKSKQSVYRKKCYENNKEQEIEKQKERNRKYKEETLKKIYEILTH
jgi:hypothetical protein